MKILIADDRFTNRLLLQELLKGYGPTDIALTGQEAVEAARAALEADAPYDLICLDIMMPALEGRQALQAIRGLEDAGERPDASRAKIVMTTALADRTTVLAAARGGCDAFLAEPIQKAKLLDMLRRLMLMTDPENILMRIPIAEEEHAPCPRIP
jgi:two-component system, chemotaxis family, chemotaxis protein CheY